MYLGPYSFQFDRVFGFDSDQKTVFEETAIPLVNDVLQGYNATIVRFHSFSHIISYLLTF